MSRKRTGLGKGLDALIPQGFTTQGDLPKSGITEVRVDSIRPNPRQPRTHFDSEAIQELAASILEHGIIQPLIVSHDPETAAFTLVAGERRLLAAKAAGLEKVPVIIREISDQGMVEIALIENIQRADLGPLEKAEAYRQLVEDFGLSHEAVSKRVGKSRAAVTNTLRLLNLPPGVQQAISSGGISEGHGRALLSLPTPQSQAAALQTILQKGLSVRQAEDLVRRFLGDKLLPKPKPEPPPAIKELEERLRTRLGTRVTVKPGRVGGSINIRYYSDEELNTLLALFLSED